MEIGPGPGPLPGPGPDRQGGPGARLTGGQGVQPTGGLRGPGLDRPWLKSVHHARDPDLRLQRDHPDLPRVPGPGADPGPGPGPGLEIVIEMTQCWH